MKILKIILGIVLVYVAIVIIFETWLRISQPESDNTIKFQYQGSEGQEVRVLSRIDVDQKLYVSANHWPRQWYYRVLENPNITVITKDASIEYVASAVTDAETINRINTERPQGLIFKLLIGFAPRAILHLEPVKKSVGEAAMDAVGGLLGKAKTAGESAAEAAGGVVDDATAAGKSVVEKAGEVVDAAVAEGEAVMEKAGEAVDAAVAEGEAVVEKVGEAVDAAAEKASETVDEAVAEGEAAAEKASEPNQ
ncbi:MAG: hypothetical protein AAF512_11500 [Pseudomonadota bacterium]